MAERWDQFGPDYDHPPFQGQPRTYLLASTPRSGSHFLGHLLLGTGVLGSPLEYFHVPHAKRWMASLGVEDFPTMLRRLHQRRTSPSGWFGVKAHWPQFAPIACNETLLRFVNIDRYIEIRRRDRVAQAISAVIAQQTLAWISFHNTSNRAPRYDFRAIHAAAEAFESQIGKWHAFFEEQGVSPFVVEYEDLISDPQAVLDQIVVEFGIECMGIPRQKWVPQRQASDLNARWHDQYHKDLATLPL